MPLVRLNPAFVALRGRVGDVVFKTYRDKVVVTRAPRFDHVVATPAQRTQRERLRAATAHAHRLYADPIAKAALVARARTLDRQPFRLAISEYLATALSDATCISPSSDRQPRRPRAVRAPARPPLTAADLAPLATIASATPPPSSVPPRSPAPHASDACCATPPVAPFSANPSPADPIAAAPSAPPPTPAPRRPDAHRKTRRSSGRPARSRHYASAIPSASSRPPASRSLRAVLPLAIRPPLGRSRQAQTPPRRLRSTLLSLAARRRFADRVAHRTTALYATRRYNPHPSDGHPPSPQRSAVTFILDPI